MGRDCEYFCLPFFPAPTTKETLRRASRSVHGEAGVRIEGNAFKCMGVQGESPGVEARLKTEPKMIQTFTGARAGKG